MAPPGSYRTHAYIQAGAKLGIEVVVASEGRHSVVPAYSQGLQIDFHNLTKTLDLVCEEANRSAFSGVVATDDTTTELAAHIAQRLGLSHNEPSAVRIARRKDLARHRLSKHEMLVPQFWLIDLTRALHHQIHQVAYPCVAKPIALSASRGVIRTDSPQQLLAACGRIRALLSELEDSEEGRYILVEEYIPGQECSIEGVLYCGSLQVLAIFDKPDSMEGPYFEETYYITPSRMPPQTQATMCHAIEQACAAYGLSEGPIHAECRVNPSGVWVLEIAARTIGGECAQVFKLGSDVGLEEVVLSHAAGTRLTLKRDCDAAGMLMIPTPRAGVLRRVEGVSAAQRVLHIEEVSIALREGYVLVPWPEGASYLGFIFARARTPAEVESALRMAHDCLHVVVSPMLRVTVS